MQSRKLLRERKAAAAHLLARCIAGTAAATYKTALKEAKRKEEEERKNIEAMRKYEEEKQIIEAIERERIYINRYSLCLDGLDDISIELRENLDKKLKTLGQVRLRD
jgi:hypothetical protein